MPNDDPIFDVSNNLSLSKLYEGYKDLYRTFEGHTTTSDIVNRMVLEQVQQVRDWIDELYHRQTFEIEAYKRDNSQLRNELNKERDLRGEFQQEFQQMEQVIKILVDRLEAVEKRLQKAGL